MLAVSQRCKREVASKGVPKVFHKGTGPLFLDVVGIFRVVAQP
jgi:hypothetical protein